MTGLSAARDRGVVPLLEAYLLHWEGRGITTGFILMMFTNYAYTNKSVIYTQRLRLLYDLYTEGLQD